MSNADLCNSDNKNYYALMLNIYQDVNNKCLYVCFTEDNPVFNHNLF